jgi:hypothetical protein
VSDAYTMHTRHLITVHEELRRQPLYPDCGCPPAGRDTWTGVENEITNVVCRNADCLDYGTHRRGGYEDRCGLCGERYTLLEFDPLRGAR